MDELKTTIHAALESNDPIKSEQVRQWISRARDIETFAYLYQLTANAWDRIEPRLERDETCFFILQYFLACIRENPPGGVALSRYEAARELESWVDHLSDMADTSQVLKSISAAVTEFYLHGTEEMRLAIETGFLEHVLEQTRLRPLFAHWADDERLRKPWQRALAWGEAHPAFVKKLREKLRHR